MQCNFLLLKLNMPNENIFFFFLQKLKRNESTREEKNAYFDTFLAMPPKSNEPSYCNKNATTPNAINFNYQPRVRKNLRGISTICET